MTEQSTNFIHEFVAREMERAADTCMNQFNCAADLEACLRNFDDARHSQMDRNLDNLRTKYTDAVHERDLFKGQRDEAIRKLEDLNIRFDLLESDLKEWVDVFRPFGQTPEACLFTLRGAGPDAPVDCCEKVEKTPPQNTKAIEMLKDALNTLSCINHLSFMIVERWGMEP